MGGASKEEITRKTKEYARITEELIYKRKHTRMSSEYELELLEKKIDLAEDIYIDLKEEECILQNDIWYWLADIKQLRRAIDSRKFPDGHPSYGEETNESQCSNESQCASSGEESDGDEKESQCAICSAWRYLEYLDTGLGVLRDSEEDYEEYLKAKHEFEVLEVSDTPFCEACVDRLSDKCLEEKKSSRYDSSE